MLSCSVRFFIAQRAIVSHSLFILIRVSMVIKQTLNASGMARGCADIAPNLQLRVGMCREYSLVRSFSNSLFAYKQP